MGKHEPPQPDKQPDTPAAPPRRSRIRQLFVLLVVYVVCELLILAALAALESGSGIVYATAPTSLSRAQRTRIGDFLAQGTDGDLRHHPVLGWEPAAASPGIGVRDDLEHPTQAAPGVLRSAAFGGSHTYSEGVELRHSWSKLLSFEVPRLEVLNFGVPGYGLDQAYLRYLEKAGLTDAQIIFIGLSIDSIPRNVSVFPPFSAGSGHTGIFSKPRFAEGGTLLANPLRERGHFERFLREDATVLQELGARDFHYQTSLHAGSFDFLPSLRLLKLIDQRTLRPDEPIFLPDGSLNTSSEAWRVTCEVLDRFYNEVLKNGSLPVVVIFPDLDDQTRALAGKSCRYQPLLDWAAERGYAVMDLLPALKPWQERTPEESLRTPEGGFSHHGNRILAASIGENLQRWGFLHQPKAVQSAIAFERKRLWLDE